MNTPRHVFNFNYSLPVIGGIFALVITASEWDKQSWTQTVAMFAVLILGAAAFMVRVIIDDNGIRIRHFFWPFWRFINWGQIANVRRVHKGRGIDCHIELYDGTTFRVSPVQTWGADRFVNMLLTRLRREQEAGLRLCTECGYDLRSLDPDSRSCPECGAFVAPRDQCALNRYRHRLGLEEKEPPRS